MRQAALQLVASRKSQFPAACDLRPATETVKYQGTLRAGPLDLVGDPAQVERLERRAGRHARGGIPAGHAVVGRQGGIELGSVERDAVGLAALQRLGEQAFRERVVLARDPLARVEGAQ